VSMRVGDEAGRARAEAIDPALLLASPVTTPHEGSVLVPWRGPVQPWGAASPSELTAQHFEQVLALEPEIVIFGSGARLTFVPPAVYRVLIAHGVGMETMDTAAASRTYNVLAMEGRSVVAALLLENPQT